MQQPSQPPPATPPPATPQAPGQSPFNPQQATPIVVQIERPRPADEVGVDDVLIGSFAMIGFLIAAALVVGLVTGAIFIGIQRWRDKNDPDSTEPTATRLKLS